MTQRKVLVTGGAGFIGNIVCEKLLQAGHEVRVLDALFWDDDALAPIRERLELIQGDCRNSKDVIYALEGVDAVIHLAGIVGDYACAKNPRAHYTINVQATQTLIDCCKNRELCKVKDFIFASTALVCGSLPGDDDIITEDAEPCPLSEYATAKMLSERIVLGAADDNFHPTVLRFTTAFGYSRRPRFDLVANLFALKAWQDKQITVFGGQQHRSFIHVQDIAAAVIAVLAAPCSERSGEIFNLGESRNSITVRELGELVCELVPGAQLIVKQENETDQRDYKIDCSKFKERFTWETQVSVRKGIEDMLEHLCNDKLEWNSPKYSNSHYDYR